MCCYIYSKTHISSNTPPIYPYFNPRCMEIRKTLHMTRNLKSAPLKFWWLRRPWVLACFRPIVEMTHFIFWNCHPIERCFKRNLTTIASTNWFPMSNPYYSDNKNIQGCVIQVKENYKKKKKGKIFIDKTKLQRCWLKSKLCYMKKV